MQWRPHRTDVLLALSVFLISLVGQLQVRGGAISFSTGPGTPAAVALHAFGAAALLWRRRWPLVVLGAVTGLDVMAQLLLAGEGIDLTVEIAIVTAAWFRPASLSLPAAIVAAACVAGPRAVGGAADLEVVWRSILSAGLLWLVGHLGWHTRRRRERERQSASEAAVQVERRRIARELHDVVAHHVTVMVVQAGAARMALAHDPVAAARPLAEIEDTGRSALGELRRLLAVLRAGDQEGDEQLSPQPGMAALDALVEQMRAAGVPVELRVKGDPRPLDIGIEVSAYRIVQESLTNVLRHAGQSATDITVEYGDDALVVEVVDEGLERPPADIAATGGHGLAGMRERAALLGGDVSAGPAEGGGFEVRARLPYGAGA